MSLPEAPPELSLVEALAEGAEALLNRLRKNQQKLKKWLRREQVACYRLYDRDLPEYAVAVDVYADHLHVQEYQAPSSVDADKARRRLAQVLAVLPEATGVAPANIVLKQRRRQRGKEQYRPVAREQHFFTVPEPPAKLRVNLTDYLDTGLFLDHRPIRRWLGEQARGKRFLNLFCYTGAATVHAAVGGARKTTSVDLSATYLDWAQANMRLNGFAMEEREGAVHERVRADCLEWLRGQHGPYDLVFMDPPVFSNSKRMQGVLDVQRDHVTLISRAMRQLSEGGELVFSTNLRRFKLDHEALQGLVIKDISRWSLPADFERHPDIHCCYRIRRR
jgi:23S rRNA (guanine2445-N2)-methyltransferase / 23S rRNA (guanine2069-N7)-methyltransferase